MSKLLVQGSGGGQALLCQGAPGLALLTQGSAEQYLNSPYLSLPGTVGNYLSTPHSAALNPAGDFTVIAYALSPDWTPSADQTIAGKYGATAANGAWRMLVDSSPLGMLVFAQSVGGVSDAATTSITLEALTGVAANEGIWLKQEFETATGLVDMFYSFDPEWKEPETVTWTTLQLNRAATAGVLGAGNTANMNVGAFNGGASAPFNGRIYRVAGYTSLTEATGNKIFDMDPKDWVSGSSWVSSRTGETWTLNGTASVVK